MTCTNIHELDTHMNFIIYGNYVFCTHTPHTPPPPHTPSHTPSHTHTHTHHTHTHTHAGGATLEFEIELLDLSKKPYSILPQGNGFFTVLCIFGVILISFYELYKRANKQGVELKESKKKLKEKEKRGKVRNLKKRD